MAASPKRRIVRDCIHELFKRNGPMTDWSLVHEYNGPPTTDSSIRTRRSELVRDGILHDTGGRNILAKRQAIVWGLKNVQTKATASTPPQAKGRTNDTQT